ncbi:hypothetical protein ACJ73_02657 [Blastomyces percursus]|uniref:Uncharacterized protein n=1 Tax=Blastomyces percursus TaxID=1658174 RepID=A0A1J9RDA6_9EURO|nr:hypothetical protein ACJ73_02657 [Blastomyces percursus]
MQVMGGRPGRLDCQTGAERQAAAGFHEWVGGGRCTRTTVSRPCSEGEPALSLALGVTIRAGGQWQISDGDLAACHHTLPSGVQRPCIANQRRQPVIDQLRKWASMKNSQLLESCMKVPQLFNLSSQSRNRRRRILEGGSLDPHVGVLVHIVLCPLCTL